jgi:molecular chaperone GrpE
MSRALAAMPTEARDQADDATKNLLAGVELTERELLKVFERYNIRKVETVGAKFDPNVHQALFEVPTKDHPPGTVVQEMQSGFAIGERCLRPAMVGVSKAEG